MSGVSKALYQQFATQLATAAKAVYLYPADHGARTQPLQRMAAILAEAHAKVAVLAVAIEEEILVVNGEPFFDSFPGSQELMDRFRERGLLRIEFARGLRGDELRAVVAMLATSPEDLMSGWDNARDFLAQQLVEHVELELEDEDLEFKAMETYSAAKSYMVDLWNESRLGRIPRGDKARSTMNDMVLLMDKDPNLLTGLTMLSDYDNYTFNHSVNVGIFALALTEALGHGSEKEKVGLGGMLHDVGKTMIPIEVINKPGRLTDEEWNLMKAHPEHSGEIVQQMGLDDIFDTVHQHHCGFNRSGYPVLPSGRELSDGALITAICDVYDSVTTLRPYQRQHTPQEGIQVLLKLKNNGHLQPQFVETFIKMLGIYPVGTAVRLNTGEIGLVAAVNHEHEDRPRILIVRDPRGNRLQIPIRLDLAADDHPGAGGKARRIVGTLDPAAIGVRPSEYLDPNKMSKGA